MLDQITLVYAVFQVGGSTALIYLEACESKTLPMDSVHFQKCETISQKDIFKRHCSTELRM